jgi:DNA-binding transcriptional MerR regulator
VDVERLQEALRLKDLLGLSLEELRELMTAEEARAALRREWRSGVEDPVRQRQILEESLSYIDRQLALIRRRRDEIATLEEELVTRRRRARDRLRSLQAEASPSS